MNAEWFTSTAFCYAIAFVAVFLATAGQILLKRSADDTLGSEGFLQKFLNARVITSYTLLLLSMFCNQLALRKVPMTVLPCITATSFIWVFLFGFLILRERPSKRKIVGVAIILVGIGISRL